MQEKIKQMIEERNALDQLIREESEKDRAEALETCKRLIAEYNFKAEELGIKFKKKTRTLAPKYLGPQGECWAGRGKIPQWLKVQMENGKKLEDFRIRE